MSFASGYSFQTNGQIGSQYTGIFNGGAAGTIANESTSAINIFTFTSLPIGLYYIDCNYLLVPQGSSSVTVVYIYTGAATTDTSTDLYPVVYNIPVSTYINSISGLEQQPMMESKFLLNVTNNDPVYINTIIYYSSNLSIAMNIANPDFHPGVFYCIATKLA